MSAKTTPKSCPGCGVIMCPHHPNHHLYKTGKWRCVDCRAPPTGKNGGSGSPLVKCAHHNCRIQGGLVSLDAAWRCAQCEEPLHRNHFSGKQPTEAMCAACRRGKPKVKTDDFSLAKAKRLPPEPAEGDAAEQERVQRFAEDFRRGQASPLLTSKGGAGVLCRALQEVTLCMHPLAEAGLSEQSRTEHLKMLNLLKEAQTKLHHLPLDRMILEVLEGPRYSKQIEWASMEHNATTMAGALKRLPQYTNNALPAISLAWSQEWCDATKNFRTLAKRHAPTGLPAVTVHHLEQAIKEASGLVKIVLMLTWACVARLGDVTQLLMENIILELREDGMYDLRVKFVRGKVIGKIDPYWIHTAIPPHYAKALQDHMSLHPQWTFLFQCQSLGEREALMRAVTRALRVHDMRYDSRALRRGAAQFLANQGASYAKIMEFTRHADVAMLKRYLSFGKVKTEEVRKSSEVAASMLWTWRPS